MIQQVTLILLILSIHSTAISYWYSVRIQGRTVNVCKHTGHQNIPLLLVININAVANVMFLLSEINLSTCFSIYRLLLISQVSSNTTHFDFLLLYISPLPCFLTLLVLFLLVLVIYLHFLLLLLALLHYPQQGGGGYILEWRTTEKK